MKTLVTFALFFSPILIFGSRLNPIEMDVSLVTDLARTGNELYKARIKGGIVGGDRSTPHAYPWTTRLAPVNCGGTIICPKFVMTAYHCVQEPGPEEVLVGAHNIFGYYNKFGFKYKLENGASTHKVAKIISHPKATTNNWTKLDYDYAIIELQTPIELRPRAGNLPSLLAAYLPEPNDMQKLNQYSPLVITGWGNTDSPTEDRNRLRVVSMNYIPGNCPYKPMDLDVDRFCAAKLGEKKDSCRGDSGGPAVWLDSDKVKLMGVVSYGSIPCGLAGWYAKITHVFDWINQVTRSCNKRTCSQDMCATKDKLMPQALGMFAGKFRYRGWV